MSSTISLHELEGLLNGDTVSDNELAAYFEVAPSSRPMGPGIRLNPDRVEMPRDRGLFAITLGFVNRRAERRRRAMYEDKLASGYAGLRFLAEGDSWFQYPIMLRDVIDVLDDDYAILCSSAAGDTIANMLTGLEDLLQSLERQKPDGLLFSAGGNDIAGEPLARGPAR